MGIFDFLGGPGNQQDVTTRGTANQTTTRDPGEFGRPLIESGQQGLMNQQAFGGPFIGDRNQFFDQGVNQLGQEGLGNQGFANFAQGQGAGNFGFQNPFAQMLGGFGGFGGAGLMQEASGQNVGAQNQFRQQQFNAAADPITEQFRFATAPSTAANFSALGRGRGAGGAGLPMQNQLQQAGLGRALGNLGASIFNPDQDLQRMQQAQMGLFGGLGQGGGLFNQAQGLQNQALGLAPALQQLQFAGPQAALQAGQFGTQRNDQEAAAAERGFGLQNLLDMQRLQAGMGLGQAFGDTTTTGTTTNTQPFFSPTGAQTLAGMGSSALNSFLGGLGGGTGSPGVTPGANQPQFANSVQPMQQQQQTASANPFGIGSFGNSTII